jgi:hypothetical protein
MYRCANMACKNANETTPDRPATLHFNSHHTPTAAEETTTAAEIDPHPILSIILAANASKSNVFQK